MLTLPTSTRIFLCEQPIDCRKSFDGLFALVQQQMAMDPFTGHLFVFRNRTGKRLKILYWDKDGLAIWYKRLEKGTFEFPRSKESGKEWEITGAELMMLLEGVDLDTARRRERYRRPPG